MAGKTRDGKVPTTETETGRDSRARFLLLTSDGSRVVGILFRPPDLRFSPTETAGKVTLFDR